MITQVVNDSLPQQVQHIDNVTLNESYFYGVLEKDGERSFLRKIEYFDDTWRQYLLSKFSCANSVPNDFNSLTSAINQMLNRGHKVFIFTEFRDFTHFLNGNK
jgi:hypothetical protein